MHVCGNDFLVIDQRLEQFIATKENIAALANYKIAIGFDQLLLLDRSNTADIKLEIYNADGSSAAACGNGSLAIAKLIFAEKDRKNITIETATRIITATKENNDIAINMGQAKLLRQDISFSQINDLLTRSPSKLTYGDRFTEESERRKGVYNEAHEDSNAKSEVEFQKRSIGNLVNIGNLHVILNWTNLPKFNSIDIASIGQIIENDSRFDERVNVNFVELTSVDEFKLSTWERGVGTSLACGSGACASFFSLHHENLVASRAKIHQPGGEVIVNIDKQDNIWLAAEAKIAYQGFFTI